MATFIEEISGIVSDDSKTADEQVDDVRAAVSQQFQGTSQKVTDSLWTWFVRGLLILLVLALVGLGWSVLDGQENTDPNLFLTVFTTVLAGLTGVFVKSPTQGKG
jgi:type VI protein secretion system component VasF